MKLPKLSLFSVCLLLLLIYGCSTTNKGTLPKMAYHDITSHYNAYFNSNEKLKNVYKLGEGYHKDKFDSVISVYPYNDPKEFSGYSSDLEDVIKRSTMAVQLHTVSNWTDDHFLLIGQANYLKGDYDKAGSSFKYITTEFKEGVDYVKVMKSLGKKVGKYVPAKRRVNKPQVKVISNDDGTKTLQKIDNRPEISLWIHTPARSQALVWLIKTYTRQKKYDAASSIVTYVKNDNLFFKNYDNDLTLAEADLLVTKKDYAGAITPLSKYVDDKKIRKHKKRVVRPLFVLAQCYQMIGNNSNAIKTYKRVLESHPSTDMEFYAKIKMAKLARGSSSNNAEIRQLLSKMARDNRYRDYWDQVYYELGLISISENNKVEARVFLHKSIDASVSNDEQKGQSFLKLAELDYDDEAYATSKMFYDSTVSFISKTDPRYEDIQERDKMLGNLVKQLNTIHDEDSMQKLAALSKPEIEKAIREAIARKQKEEEDKKSAAETAKQQAALLSGPSAGSPASSWYFYNATARAAGYNEFIRKWGKRTLEENWRRKNKASTNADEEAAGEGADSASAKVDTTATAVKGTVEEQMYAAIPTTPEKMAKSNERIEDAYYTAGTIYKDGLDAYDKAAEMFEALNSKYPKNKLLLESYYNLYLIALKQKKADRMEMYKAKILAEFPESVIAKVLRDPNYINQAKNKEKLVDDYFDAAYLDYSNGKLDSAWYKCEMSNALFKPNPLAAKFELLEALILSKQNRLGDYVQALNKIITKSNDNEVKKTASDLLTYLNRSSLPQVDLSKDPARLDSLNRLYQGQQTGTVSVGNSSSNSGPNAAKPDSTEMTLLDKLNAAKQLAIKQGKLVDTTQAKPAANGTVVPGATNVDSSGKAPIAEENVPTEDTTSPYKRTDAAVHYFIVYIKDPAAPESALMSTMAKVDAFNSTQFPTKRLTSKRTLIDSKNRMLLFRQFKSKDEALEYYNAIKTQGQLFNDFKPGQYAITVISTPNYSTLLSEKDVDAYQKFFFRVYK